MTSLVNFLLLSHCTVDKDIVPGDIMKLSVYVGQLGYHILPIPQSNYIKHVQFSKVLWQYKTKTNNLLPGSKAPILEIRW